MGVNIPTGKDSLSMTQKYGDRQVHSPGTVIITAAGEVENFRKAVSPALKKKSGSKLVYIDFSGDDFHLGGAFAQVLGQTGNRVPKVKNVPLFIQTFDAVQQLIKEGKILAGHDVSAGGLITTLLEMCFPHNGMGMKLTLENLTPDIFSLFSEKPAIVIQVNDLSDISFLKSKGIAATEIGETASGDIFSAGEHQFSVSALREKWFHASYLLDEKQRPTHAKRRKENIFKQELSYQFPTHFIGKRP
ncbi:MAG: phosphoribosylformylglycinamidine synthase, partial [Candidatus Nephrothrix sp. EaCA]